jgi:hypothetical protein
MQLSCHEVNNSVRRDKVFSEQRDAGAIIATASFGFNAGKYCTDPPIILFQ